MINLLGALSIFGSIGATAILVFGLLASRGAPQQAAVAGIALAVAVIPYTLFRVALLAKQSADTEAIRRAVEKLSRREVG